MSFSPNVAGFNFTQCVDCLREPLCMKNGDMMFNTSEMQIELGRRQSVLGLT